MVKGIQQLNRKLTITIPAKVEAATRKAMEKGAEELVTMMKRLVPVDKGDLRDSIGWNWNEAPAGAHIIAESVSDSRGLKIVVHAGDEVAFYDRFVEFGTVNAPAHPFFYPSYRALRKRIKSRITRDMKKAIQAESAKE